MENNGGPCAGFGRSHYSLILRSYGWSHRGILKYNADLHGPVPIKMQLKALGLSEEEMRRLVENELAALHAKKKPGDANE